MVVNLHGLLANLSFQLGVFFYKSPQLFGLTDIHSTVGLLPAVESRTSNGVLATDFGDR